MSIDWTATASQLEQYLTTQYVAEVTSLLDAVNAAGATYASTSLDSSGNLSTYGENVHDWWQGGGSKFSAFPQFPLSNFGPAPPGAPPAYPFWYGGAMGIWANLDRWARYCYTLASRTDQAAGASAFGVTPVLGPKIYNIQMTGNPSVTFVASSETLTRATGDFLADGFLVGDVVRVSTGTTSNNFILAITALTSTVMTFASGVVDQGPISNVQVVVSTALNFPAPATLPPDVTGATTSTLTGRSSAAAAMTSVSRVVLGFLSTASTNWSTAIGLRPSANPSADSAGATAIAALNAALAPAQAWLAAVSFT